MEMSSEDRFVIQRARRTERIWTLARYPLVPAALLGIAAGYYVRLEYIDNALAPILGGILMGFGVGLLFYLATDWKNQERELLLRLAEEKDSGLSQ